jgi:hypothetical protein
VVLQLDLLQEGGLPGDVKVMGSGLHTGLHHSLPVESNKKEMMGHGTHRYLLEINTVPDIVSNPQRFQILIQRSMQFIETSVMALDPVGSPSFGGYGSFQPNVKLKLLYWLY